MHIEPIFAKVRAQGNRFRGRFVNFNFGLGFFDVCPPFGLRNQQHQIRLENLCMLHRYLSQSEAWEPLSCAISSIAEACDEVEHKELPWKECQGESEVVKDG